MGSFLSQPEPVSRPQSQHRRRRRKHRRTHDDDQAQAGPRRTKPQRYGDDRNYEKVYHTYRTPMTSYRPTPPRTTKRQSYRTPLVPDEYPPRATERHGGHGDGRKKRKRRSKVHREVDEEDSLTRPRRSAARTGGNWEPIGGLERKKGRGQSWMFV